MTTISVVGECFFWYRLTRVVPDNFHRAVKRLCVCVCVSDKNMMYSFLWDAICKLMKWVCTVFLFRTVKPVTVNHGVHMPSWYSHFTSFLLVFENFIMVTASIAVTITQLFCSVCPIHSASVNVVVSTLYVTLQ